MTENAIIRDHTLAMTNRARLSMRTATEFADNFSCAATMSACRTVSCQQECQNCSPRMTKLCILKFLLKKIQLSSFFLYLNIPKNTFKHFLKMILNFDNLLNLFVPFIWHFTQCHFSSFNPIYIPLYHILYASLSLIFIFSDSDDVRSASS